MSGFSTSYTPTAKAFHWLMALLILAATVFGIYAAYFLHYGSDPAQNAYKAGIIDIHKNLATVTLFLIAARLYWRFTHKPPELVGMNPLMARLAHAGHWMRYALMVIVPVSGWANSSSAGYRIPVAWLFEIPHLIDKDKSLTPLLSTIHEYTTWTLVVLVVGHVGFALKHHFIDRNETMASMLPNRK